MLLSLVYFWSLSQASSIFGSKSLRSPRKSRAFYRKERSPQPSRKRLSDCSRTLHVSSMRAINDSELIFNLRRSWLFIFWLTLVTVGCLPSKSASTTLDILQQWGCNLRTFTNPYQHPVISPAFFLFLPLLVKYVTCTQSILMGQYNFWLPVLVQIPKCYTKRFGVLPLTVIDVERVNAATICIVIRTKVEPGR